MLRSTWSEVTPRSQTLRRYCIISISAFTRLVAAVTQPVCSAAPIALNAPPPVSAMCRKKKTDSACLTVMIELVCVTRPGVHYYTVPSLPFLSPAASTMSCVFPCFCVGTQPRMAQSTNVAVHIENKRLSKCVKKKWLLICGAWFERSSCYIGFFVCH